MEAAFTRRPGAGVAGLPGGRGGPGTADAPADLRGPWSAVNEFRTAPDGPLQRSEGTAVGRSVGAHWVMLEVAGDHFGTPSTGVLVLGRSDPPASASRCCPSCA
ncbi:MAG: DUF1579 family protein [Armatimonadetes bacterium]|nr:DUF1579 family protein [Armatimonadota bacterium]